MDSFQELKIIRCETDEDAQIIGKLLMFAFIVSQRKVLIKKFEDRSLEFTKNWEKFLNASRRFAMYLNDNWEKCRTIFQANKSKTYWIPLIAVIAEKEMNEKVLKELLVIYDLQNEKRLYDKAWQMKKIERIVEITVRRNYQLNENELSNMFGELQIK